MLHAKGDDGCWWLLLLLVDKLVKLVYFKTSSSSSYCSCFSLMLFCSFIFLWSMVKRIRWIVTNFRKNIKKDLNFSVFFFIFFERFSLDRLFFKYYSLFHSYLPVTPPSMNFEFFYLNVPFPHAPFLTSIIISKRASNKLFYIV